jgi:dTDP-glucose 4,6-dehydratase
MNLLVSGGAGFIGSAYVRHARRERPAAPIVVLDALTYAGSRQRLADIADDPLVVFVHGDIRDRAQVEALIRAHAIGAIVNFAAETHVDRSILAAQPFLDTNVNGTLQLLEAARATGCKLFVQVSTDEVYGPLDPGMAADELAPLRPRSPYAASKAAADLLALAFHYTHDLDVRIARSCNTFGPWQYPEKLIPLMVANALRGERLPVYGDGLQVREWLHVEDCCAAIDSVLFRGAGGEVYNVGSGESRTNLEVIHALVGMLGCDASLITHVPDRPGHDRRYALDCAKAVRDLGWRPARRFDQALADAVAWYRENAGWFDVVASRNYRAYYQQQYASRLNTAGVSAR